MKTNEVIFDKQVYKCFIWVTNLGAIHGEVLPNCFLPTQTIKVEILFHWWLAFKQHNTKLTNTNQKTLVNQLILDKICSLPAGGTVKRLNCKSCLKSGGLHEFFSMFSVCFVLFCSKAFYHIRNAETFSIYLGRKIWAAPLLPWCRHSMLLSCY